MEVDSFDAVIVGAGPAGMSAAIELVSAGASVCVLDRNADAGGQIYRNVASSPLAAPEILGNDYLAGLNLVERFKNCGATYISNADIWHIGRTGEALFTRNRETERVVGKKLILCPGAMERAFPVPGWHKKGVMTAGNAQALLKSSGVVCDDAVFAGTGPLLYLVVAQYLRLGARVRALIDTTESSPFLQAVKSPLAVLTAPRMVRKGISLLSEIRASGTRVLRNVGQIEITGESEVTGVAFELAGRAESIEASFVFLHQGVIPNLNMAQALALKHHWSPIQLCWIPETDEWGRSSQPNVSLAGDGSGIVGAEGAEHAGRLAGLDAALQLDLIDKKTRDDMGAVSLRRLSRLNKFRAFLDRVYAPRHEHRVPPMDSTIVCRCEEQTVADLRRGFELGATTPNSLKSQTRCGMGPCQGRQCGHTVSELLAKWRGVPPEEVGYYRLRSPQRLLSFDELSRFQTPHAQGENYEAAP